MTSMILWIVGLTGFVLAGKHSPFLLDVPETSWGELIRMWGSWSLGSLSSIVMLIINYPKVRDVIKKHISNSKKRK
jgi:hypothetical protein